MSMNNYGQGLKGQGIKEDATCKKMANNKKFCYKWP